MSLSNTLVVILFFLVLALYSPFCGATFLKSVQCQGRIGVWRVLKKDFTATDAEIDAVMQAESTPFQPEEFGFQPTKLVGGMLPLLII